MISDTTRHKWRIRTDYLIDRDDKLNDWELGFIENMDRILDRGGDLSIAQSFKLGEIFKRIDKEDTV